MLVAGIVILLAASAFEEKLYVGASLTGHNLVWPPGDRCCAFTLNIYPDGRGTVIIQAGLVRREVSLEVSSQTLEALRLAVNKEDFFSLPEAVGKRLVYGNTHQMVVHLGKRKHFVTLYNWPNDWSDTDYLSREELDHTRRAYKVWKIIRSLVTDPQATVQ